MADGKSATGNIKINLVPNRMAIEIVMPAGDTAQARGILSAAQVDTLIATLANIRSKMTPEVPRQFPQTTGKVHVLPGGESYLGYDPMSDCVVLSFRAAGFGWMSFSLPEGALESFHSHLPILQEARAAVRSGQKH